MSVDPSAATPLEVLHFTGYSSGRGGVNSALRALVGAAGFRSVVGVHPDFPAAEAGGLQLLPLPAIDAERISAQSIFRAWVIARAVQNWLRASPSRLYHGHSRAGLLITLWLQALGEHRAVSTVRCLGRQRWLYRLAHARLGGRLLWLGPAMKQHYGIAPADWSDCLPDAVPEESFHAVRSERRHGAVLFAAVGALVPVKQWEDLMRAAAAVPAARFVHAGTENGTSQSADYAARLRSLHHELGLGQRWVWRGEVADMRGLLDSVDCLVIASPWEASSMAALEAIAAGVPVLAPVESGTRDLLARTGGGWTYSGPVQLKEKLSEIAASGSTALWRRNDAALAWFGARRVAKEHERVYRTLLK